MIGYNTMGYGTGMFEAVFALMFLIFIAVFVTVAVKGISQWNRNNHSPRLTVEARVVSKRTDISRHVHSGDNMHHHTSTSYYVTFEVESGDRMEMQLEGYEYGLLVEGDRGRLTFQGTRYLGFERT